MNGRGLSATVPPRLEQAAERRTLAVIVDDEPGVLARVVGLFSARGYNIESLTVAETDHETRQSRITIVTSGQAIIIDQIKAQLERIVSVHKVVDVTLDPAGVERELALIKVRSAGQNRIEALRVSEIFRAKVIDTTLESFIFELTGASEKIDAFTDLMRPLGLVEVSRTGVLSIRRGPDPT
jgi:acetolactate synthase-1/3 small subunit